MAISLSVANQFYAWGWRFSILGAVVTAAAVAFLMIGTYVRDREAAAELSRINLEAARANERAATLELESAKIKQQIAWRTVTPEQREIIRERITSEMIQGQMVTLDVYFEENQEEPASYALDIERALRNAGVKPFLQPSRPFATGPPIVGLVFRPAGGNGEQSAAIREALEAAGIAFSTAESRLGGNEIYVGRKPPP